MRAVGLYIKLGRRVRATIRELGYPTKNAFEGWHRGYERWQDLPIRSVPRLPKFSEAQKQVALEHCASQRCCISWTLHPSRATLTAWVREAFPETGTVSTGAYGAGNHSDAEKKAAVVGLYSRQERAQAPAERVGVSRPTPYAWKNQLLGPEIPATIKRKKSASLDPEREELERQREALQRCIRELQIGHDLLKTASEMIKKDFGGDLLGLSNQEKTMLIVALKNRQNYRRC
jgi:putative transposase